MTFPRESAFTPEQQRLSREFWKDFEEQPSYVAIPKTAKETVAVDKQDLESWYADLNRLEGDDAKDIRDAIYRYLP